MLRGTVMLGIGMLVAMGSTGAADELDVLPLGDQDRAYEIVSAPAGGFFDCTSGEVRDLDGVLDALADARVILLGEEHTSMEQKLLHARLLDGLAERGRTLVLGMEFFLRSDDEALARWGAGAIDDEQLLREVGWYDRGGYRWDYYRPVMDAARRHGVPVVGLNVPREIPRTVNRSGLAGLSDEQRDEVGPVEVTGSPQHRYLVSRYFGETVALMPPGWLDNMYAAQCLWDVVMARSILERLPEDATMVVVVGSGHVAYGLGIPRRLAEERAAAGAGPLPVGVLCPVRAPAPDPEGQPHGHPMGGGEDEAGAGGQALFVRSLADVVAVFPDDGGIEAFPRLGLQLGEDDEGPTVRMVFPDSLAEDAGVEPGDRIVAINGISPTDLSDLRWRLAEIEWGQRLELEVERGGEVVAPTVLLFPDIVDDETEVAPGWSVDVPAVVDPAGSDIVVAAPMTGEPVTSRLLSHHDVPVRVEVRTGDRLDVVHELDEAGRVVRSLYREPLSDGAVEVLYERGEDGVVVTTTRHDTTGSTL